MKAHTYKKNHIPAPKNALLILLSLMISLGLSAGCGKEAPAPAADHLPKTDITVPFTSLGWDATQADVISLEGKSEDAYDGIYGGPVLVYDREYLSLNGQVLYMFDKQDRLADIAWKLTTRSESRADAAMEKLTALLTSSCGDPTFNNPHESATGNKWENGEVSVILNKVTTGGKYIVQVAYLNKNTAVLMNDSEE